MFHSMIFQIPFLLIATCASLFYGLRAIKVFGVNPEGRPKEWVVHQFWFNFCGSAFGWAALWFESQRIAIAMQLGGTAIAFGWADIGLVATSFVGITGHLPYAVQGLLIGIIELATKVTGKVGG